MTSRVRRAIAGSVAVVLIAALIAWRSISPRSDRAWIDEQAVMPRVAVDGHMVRIGNVRTFRFTARHEFATSYAERAYDLDKLESVWYVLTPFSLRWRGPAHSFVTFGFSDSQFVAVSVEARREPGENYDVLTGLFKRYELMYVVGDERDLIGQRAAFGTDRVYLYPIKAKPEQMRAMFLSMLDRANRLREHPEFYNTLTNNCTSNVIAHVNDVKPGTVATGIKTILPGYTDEVAYGLGLIDTRMTLEQARDRYLINDRARKYLNDSLFSFRIRAPEAGTK